MTLCLAKRYARVRYPCCRRYPASVSWYGGLTYGSTAPTGSLTSRLLLCSRPPSLHGKLVRSRLGTPIGLRARRSAHRGNAAIHYCNRWTRRASAGTHAICMTY